MLSMATLESDGALFVEMLRVRRAVFVDSLGWDLPQADGMEFDQYDTPFSRWVVVHCAGHVYGGMRFTPTTARLPNASYMIRDAQMGLLPHLPRTILDAPAPVAPDVWETSRVFFSNDIPRAHGLAARLALGRGMVLCAAQVGARRTISLLPLMWQKWNRRYGVPMSHAGPVFGAPTPYQAVWTEVASDAARRPFLSAEEISALEAAES